MPAFDKDLRQWDNVFQFQIISNVIDNLDKIECFEDCVGNFAKKKRLLKHYSRGFLLIII